MRNFQELIGQWVKFEINGRVLRPSLVLDVIVDAVVVAMPPYNSLNSFCAAYPADSITRWLTQHPEIDAIRQINPPNGHLKPLAKARTLMDIVEALGQQGKPLAIVPTDGRSSVHGQVIAHEEDKLLMRVYERDFFQATFQVLNDHDIHYLVWDDPYDARLDEINRELAPPPWPEYGTWRVQKSLHHILQEMFKSHVSVETEDCVFNGHLVALYEDGLILHCNVKMGDWSGSPYFSYIPLSKVQEVTRDADLQKFFPIESKFLNFPESYGRLGSCHGLLKELQARGEVVDIWIGEDEIQVIIEEVDEEVVRFTEIEYPGRKTFTGTEELSSIQAIEFGSGYQSWLSQCRDQLASEIPDVKE